MTTNKKRKIVAEKLLEARKIVNELGYECSRVYVEFLGADHEKMFHGSNKPSGDHLTVGDIDYQGNMTFYTASINDMIL